MSKVLVFADNFSSLLHSCKSYYEASKQKIRSEPVCVKRAKLADFSEAFHRDCGTLTAPVQKRLENLKNGNCIVLMTAHQPNFFAYGGVMRKATLNFVLARQLEKTLGVPVVNFFGFADQDFADDRWVKSAFLPDVERRDGLLELRFNAPEKLLLNRVAKPSRNVLNGWQSEIEKWFNRKLCAIGQLSKSFGIDFDPNCHRIRANFEDFWGIVEDAYGCAEVFSDFNGFLISKVVNEVWEYDTIFSRFSECQEIFEDDFSFLLSHLTEYSTYLKEATARVGTKIEEDCYDVPGLLPFWYHCDCGSKARLIADYRGEHLVGGGKCLRCEKEYSLDFGLKNAPELSGVSSIISARSISMPLVFFGGLAVGSYIGGAGGKDYLSQAGYVAGKLGLPFPPIVIWRPKDVYFGIGQLEAAMVFRKVSPSFGISEFSAAKTELARRIAVIQEQVDALEHKKTELAKSSASNKDDVIERMKLLSFEQARIRRETGFSLIVRDLKLLENVGSAMNLHPCMIDYAVNVGLKSTSEQWMVFLQQNGSFSSDVPLKADFQDFGKFSESSSYMGYH